MFRLIKLAVYGLLGYAIYEFCRGLLQGENMAQAAGLEGGGRGGSRTLDRALDSDAGRMNMTGPAQGARVTSGEATGESVPHLVGRGVVHR